MKIRLIRLMSGEQIVGEIHSWGPDGSSGGDMQLLNPIILVPAEDGSINLVPWCPLADKESTVHVKHRNIVYIATPSNELTLNYKDIFSPIITPQNAGKIIT